MENVCLYDFVSAYIKCGVEEHGNTQYRHLNKTTLGLKGRLLCRHTAQATSDRNTNLFNELGCIQY